MDIAKSGVAAPEQRYSLDRELTASHLPGRKIYVQAGSEESTAAAGRSHKNPPRTADQSGYDATQKQMLTGLRSVCYNLSHRAWTDVLVMVCLGAVDSECQVSIVFIIL